MINEPGHFSVATALMMALSGVVYPQVGLRFDIPPWENVAA
jgi:hypothetical protein